MRWGVQVELQRAIHVDEAAAGAGKSEGGRMGEGAEARQQSDR